MSDLKGFKELSKTLKNLDGKQKQKVVRRGNAKMAQIIAKEMKMKAPKNSGNLKKSITYNNKRMRSGGFFAKVGAFKTARADGFYARFVEFGTKKHEIKPKNRKVLRVNGGFSKSVTHKGARPKPFLESAFKSSYRRAQNEAGQLMFKLISEIK